LNQTSNGILTFLDISVPDSCRCFTRLTTDLVEASCLDPGQESFAPIGPSSCTSASAVFTQPGKEDELPECTRADLARVLPLLDSCFKQKGNVTNGEFISFVLLRNSPSLPDNIFSNPAKKKKKKKCEKSLAYDAAQCQCIVPFAEYLTRRGCSLADESFKQALQDCNKPLCGVRKMADVSKEFSVCLETAGNALGK
jgi:hypothetical protein